jgi:hypothetical protein
MKPMMTRKSQIESRAVMNRMREETQLAVLAEMRSAQQLAELAGHKPDSMRGDLERWKAEGRIFAVEHEGTEYFPTFALEPGAEYRPRRVIAEVLHIFDAIGWKNPWDGRDGLSD